MKIAILEQILATAIDCVMGHTGIEDADDAAVVAEAERLGELLELAKSQGLTDVTFHYSKGTDK